MIFQKSNLFILLVLFSFYFNQAHQIKNEFKITEPTYTKLTILTAPIGKTPTWQHEAVMRSLITGLQNIEANFNHNPRSLQEVGDVVFVPSDFDALRQAIMLRKNQKIKKLIAGPNLINLISDQDYIIRSPEIDTYILPSQWPLTSFLNDEPSLKERMQVWYAGVDTNFWMPSPANDKHKKTTNNVLVYWKTESELFCSQVEKTLKKNNWYPIRIQYGHYNKNQYRNILSDVAFAVFISRSETQGLALVEAWSMDIPTLVWDQQQPIISLGKTSWPVSACPYLCKENGLEWKNIHEFEIVLKNITSQLGLFNPRNWVLRNMSDEVSAQLLLKIINSKPDAKIDLNLG